MEIVDMGNKMKLTDEKGDITPAIDRIKYNEGLYFCKERLEVKFPYSTKLLDVDINFCISEKFGDLTGPVYNSYFKNVDYLESIHEYNDYKINLTNRILKDYVKTKRDEFNTSKGGYWKYRK